MAHSQLVTTDLYAVCMITISVYYFWRFNHERSWKNALISAMALGIGQLAKFTSVFLYPLFILMYLLFDLPQLIAFIKQKEIREIGRYLWKGSAFLLVFVLIGISIINIGYLFNGTLTPLGDYAFKSDLFNVLQERLSFMGQVPLPLPVPFLEGLDWTKYNDVAGDNQGYVYLLGNLYTDGKGVPGYFFVAMLLKVPIPIWVVILWALYQYFAKEDKGDFWKKEQFMLVPVTFFLIYFNFFFHTQLGIRFILIIFPLLYVFSSRLLGNLDTIRAQKLAAVGVLSIYLVVSNLSYFPHYLAYFNEFVWRRELAYKYLADSNLDWGQNDYYLKQYLGEHPDVLYRQRRPEAGTIVVSVNELVGIWGQTGKFAWLRENFEPVATIGYSYLIYQVTDEDIANLDPRYVPCPTCPLP
jgi:hypothetical protein